MTVRRAPIILRGPEYAAIRAFRAESRDQMLRRQFAFLGVSAPGSAARLLRALRAERRAAVSGRGYDPARHYALLRVIRGKSQGSPARGDV